MEMPKWMKVAATALGAASMEAGCAPEEIRPPAERQVVQGTGYVVASGPSETDPTKANLTVLINGFPVRATVPLADLPLYQDRAGGEVEVIVDYRERQENGETRVEILHLAPAGKDA